MLKQKILFLGTPEIAVPSLESIAKLGNVEVIGVGVFPDRKVGRKQILTPCAVKVAAKKLKLPIFEIEKKSDLEKVFAKTKPDLAIVIAFGMIFPASILTQPKFGVINVHFSLLPKFRGASPVQSAILEGHEISGITWQHMAPKLDSGDILRQERFEIAHKKTSEVWEGFAEETARFFPEFLEKLFGGKIKPHKQDEREATFCRKFEKSDGEIHPAHETATQIWHKFLAFDVFPGIFLMTKKGNMKLSDISLETDMDNLHKKDAFELACKNNTKILIHRAQLPGKKVMTMAEILRGNPGLFDFPDSIEFDL